MSRFQVEKTVEVGVVSLPEDLKNTLIHETTLTTSQAEIVEETLHTLLLKELDNWETRICKRCGQQFTINKNTINSREDKGQYCSATCYYINAPKLW